MEVDTNLFQNLLRSYLKLRAVRKTEEGNIDYINT